MSAQAQSTALPTVLMAAALGSLIALMWAIRQGVGSITSHSLINS